VAGAKEPRAQTTVLVEESSSQPYNYSHIQIMSGGFLTLTRQESHVAQPNTIIYTHPDCAYSSAALMDYRKRKVEYIQIDLSKQTDQIPALLELTNGDRVTPVIVENGVVTIGFKGGT